MKQTGYRVAGLSVLKNGKFKKIVETGFGVIEPVIGGCLKQGSYAFKQNIKEYEKAEKRDGYRE